MGLQKLGDVQVEVVLCWTIPEIDYENTRWWVLIMQIKDKRNYRIWVNTTIDVIKVSDADLVLIPRKSCTAFTALNLFWRYCYTELCNDITKKLVAEKAVVVANWYGPKAF